MPRVAQRAFKLRLTLSGQILLTLALAGFFVFGGLGEARAEGLDEKDFAIWRFDEQSGGIVHDFSGQGNDLSWEHNPWAGGRIIPERVPGKFDLAAGFSQKEEFFRKDFSPAISFSEGLAIGLWLKTDLNSSDESVILWLGNTINPAGDPADYLNLSVKYGRIKLKISEQSRADNEGNPAEAGLESGAIVNDDSWHFVTIKLDNAGTMALYIDGQKEAEGEISLPVPDMERLEIGRRTGYYLPYANNFKGAVDDFFIRKEAAADEEIARIYYSGQPYKGEINDPNIFPPGLKVIYHLDGSGTIAADSSENGYDLQWNSNPWGGGEAEPRWTSGKYGQAINFRGVDDNFSKSFAEPLGFPDGISFGAWVKTGGSSEKPSNIFYLRKYFSSYEGSDNIILSEQGGRPRLELNLADGCDSTTGNPFCHNRHFSLFPERFINDNSWHFISAAFDSRPNHHFIRLYVDGQSEAELFFPDILPEFDSLVLGFREDYYCGSQCNFSGDIDDFFVMSSVLTAEEMSQTYASNQPFSWPLEEPALDPVIIVPGIMGSYLVRENTYEEIWPRISTMLIDPWDGYLNELAMGTDGMPNPESGNLQPVDIFRNLYGEDFFAGLISELTASGYEEGVNLFVFSYDWRLDLNIIAGDDSRLPRTETLKEKVESVISQTGAEKVDIVAHSMGGLITKLYMQEYGGDKVNKFVDIATPHLGAPETMKTLMYGDNLDIKAFGSYILNSNTIYNISQNLPSIYQLLPSQNYFDDSDPNYAYYIYDMFDFDNNGVKGRLDYGQSIEFQANSGRNINLLALNNQLHQEIDGFNSESFGIKTYNIVGCGQPTIGQIYILNKEKSGGYEYGLKYVNGDGTVPLRSAEYLSATDVYYNTGAAHAFLPSFGGVRQLVSSILHGEEGSFSFSQHANIRTDASSCALNGTQISFHSPIDLHVYDDNDNHVGSNENGDIEINITGAAYDEIEGNKFVFLPAGKAYRIIGEAEEAGSFNARVEKVQAGNYTETVYYNEIPLNSALVETRISINDSGIANNLELDEEGDGIYETIINPDSILNEEERADLARPVTNISPAGTVGKDGYFISEVQIELAAEDDNSGVLKTEYSLDDSQNWIEYQEQFLLAEDGEYKIIYYSIDRAGNREEEKNEVIKIDKTKPEVLLSIPGEISHDQKLNISYNASDNYSGIASGTIAVYLDDKLLTANTIDLFYHKTGEHALKIIAEDMAGNTGSSTVKFKITVTPDSVISDIQRLYDLRWINDRTISKILIREIEDIKWYLNRLNEAKDRIIKNIARIEASNQSAKMKTKLIQRYNEELERLDRENDKKLNFVYDRIERSLGKYLKRNLINHEAYDIIKDNINYLRGNL